MYTSNGFAKARFKDAGDQEAVSFLMVKKAIAVWWVLPSQSNFKREQNSCFSPPLELQLRDRTSLSVYISLSFAFPRTISFLPTQIHVYVRDCVT